MMGYTNVQAALSLGSNLGERLTMIRDAERLLGERAGIVTVVSSIYETSPWGLTNQPDFLNRVLLMQTSLGPHALLDLIKRIEHELGRRPAGKWTAREIDIDILLYGPSVLSLETLAIPHPMLAQRRFSLLPLAEVWPDCIHPQLNKKITSLLKSCPDQGRVQRVNYLESAIA